MDFDFFALCFLTSAGVSSLSLGDFSSASLFLIDLRDSVDSVFLCKLLKPSPLSFRCSSLDLRGAIEPLFDDVADAGDLRCWFWCISASALVLDG